MFNPQDPKIIERYKTLPQPLKDALWAEETIDHVFDVGKAQKLTVSQMGELADIVGMVILGILKPEDFGSEIQRKLNLTMERKSAADAIVVAINEKIFAPLRNEILKIEKKNVSSPQPKIRNIEQALPISNSQISPPYEGGVGEVKTAPQPTSIFAKHIPASPELPRGEPEPPRYAGRDPYREPIDDGRPETPITKPATPPPKAPQLGGQTPQVQKIISWSDIAPEKEKANSHPDAKSALERAMNNDGIAPKPTSPNYPARKDPYREPI